MITDHDRAFEDRRRLSDHCFRCGTHRGHPDDTDCWNCEQVNAYSPDMRRMIDDLMHRFPGFQPADVDAEGQYKRRYCDQTGRAL